MKILLKGYYGFGNLGDDILMKTTWGIIQDQVKDREISIYSNFNKNLLGFDRAETYNEYIYIILDAKPELIDWTATRTYDLLIDGGGGVYFDYMRGKWFHRLLNTCIQILGCVFVLKIDKLIRKFLKRQRHLNFDRRIGLGLSIGPYTTTSKLLYSQLVDITLTNILFVRDKPSLRFLEKYKYMGEKFLGTDLAFCSEYWLPPGVSHKATQFNGNLGLVLLDWHEGNEYRFREFKKLAQWAARLNFKVTFFSLDENNDKAYIQEFHSEYNLIVWQPHKLSLYDFLVKVAEQDIVLSARAHGVIISSILGVPSVCIGTSKKLVEVSKMFPSSSSLIPEPVSSIEMQLCVETMIEKYTQLLQGVQVDVAANQKRATAMLNSLRVVL